MKEIKDYLHLYKYVMCVGKNGLTYQFRGYEENMAIISEHETGRVSKTYIENLNPILRPLSSMTDEDRIQLHGILSVSEGEDYSKYPDEYKSNYAALYLCDGSYKPMVFTWLLSKHFDLFGLIEAGLAIDATKIPST